ncbi:hypothetical protein BH09PSE6_BH09PSE6_12710 [soil metagenome]
MTASRTPSHQIVDPSVWKSDDFGPTRSWVHDFTDAQITELVEFTRGAVKQGLDYVAISKIGVSLPLCASLMAVVYHELEEGAGFSVIGRFPVERFTYAESLIAYAALTNFLGRLVDQTYSGEMKADVKDLGVAYSKDVRGYKSNAMLRFHTDGAAFTGLLCLGESAEGGLSVLTSSGALNNELREVHPDAYRLLEEGFHHHRRGEHAPGENKVSARPIPVFAFYDGLLQCTYDRNQSIWSAEEGVVFTPEQIAAMDLLDATMARPEFQLHMEMRTGDIQFVNNYTVMHARTEYRNSAEKQRHLVRYWIDPVDGKRKGFTTRDLYTRASEHV